MRCKLSEIALVSAGQGAPQGDSNYCESGTPFVKAGNLQELSNGASIDAIQKVSNEVAATHGLKLQRKGSVLFAKSGMSCLKGYVYVLPEDAYIVSHLACVTPMGVDSDYLCYYFRFHRPNKLVKDAAYPSISLADIGCLEIEIPEGNEVTQIVDALKRVESIINLHCQQFTALDTLIKARFVEMFGDPISNPKGWDSVGLLELGSCKNGMNFHTDDAGVEVHCLGVGDFKDKSVISDTSVLPLVSLNEMPLGEYLLQDGDIVFVRSNGNKALVGRCLAVFPGQIQTTFSGFCIRFRKRSHKVTTEYLIHVLKTESMRKKMQGRGANIQNLNQQILGSLSIPVPPVDMQNRFSECVYQVDKSKAVVQKALDEAQTLFDSLMQQYFG